jgi:hypothetical protein
MNGIPNLMDRPDLILLAVVGLLFVLIVVVAIISVAIPGVAKRALTKEILDNPAIQERMKDPQFNVVELINSIWQQPTGRNNSGIVGGMVGLLGKVNQDITWDVSGLIGIMVTIVLMVLLVTQNSDSIPREILAGWTTILGFYFGKAVKK